MSAPIIDAHQHFWDFLPIHRRFDLDDLRPSLERFNIHGTVLVQTWNRLAETRAFLKLASRTNFLWGVVGWVGWPRS